MENETPQIGKFKASRLLFNESLRLLKQDTEILLFPFYSLIFSLIALIIIVGGGLFIILGSSFITVFTNPALLETIANSSLIITGIVLIIVTQMIDMYFKSGIIVTVNERINNGNYSLRESLDLVKKKSGKILSWALINSSVGIILQEISNRSKLLGKIVVWFVGAAWNITTFFMLPIIVLENLGIRDSGKKSVSIIRKTWGEALITNVGVSLYLIVFFLLGFIPVLLAIFSGIKIFVIASIVFMVVYSIAITLLGSTLGTIIKVILYRYANDESLPDSFPKELAQIAFRKK